MIIKYFSWVKDIIGKSEEIISISKDIDTPEKLIDYLIKKSISFSGVSISGEIKIFSSDLPTISFTHEKYLMTIFINILQMIPYFF